jgi:hypothetical protein
LWAPNPEDIILFSDGCAIMNRTPIRGREILTGMDALSVVDRLTVSSAIIEDVIR